MRLLLLMLLVLSVCFQPAFAAQDILSEDQLVEEVINYETETVRVGTFEKPAGTAASEFFPLNYGVRFKLDNAKFVEYTVSRGTEVKAGDVLMRFVIEGSDVEFTRMKMDLERLIESTEEGIRTREEQIRVKRAEVAALTDSLEREKATLQLKRMELELKQYAFQQQYSIDNQQAAVDEEETNRNTTELLAPVDGIVTSVNFKQPDDAIANGETMVYMYSTDVMLLKIDNTTAKLRYNMPVNISAGPAKNRITTTGRVIAADGAIDETDRTGKAYIQLDDYEMLAGLTANQMRDPTLNGAVIRLEDVLLVPKHAVSLENGRHYVTKLVDGMVQKRYIEYGVSNNTEVWVLQGVEEGETLIID